MGTGETLRERDNPAGTGGGGPPGNRWDSQERNSAGKELRMLEGTPEQTAWEISGQQSALNTCLH